MRLNTTTNRMAEKLHRIEVFLNSKTLRERALLLASFLAVTFFIWQNIIFGYLLASTEELAENKQKMLSQIGQLEGQIDTLSEAIGRDPTANLEKKLKQTTEENRAVAAQIKEYSQTLTQPKEMTEILRSILMENQNIKIIKMDSLEDKSILPKDSSIQVYEKGIALEFEATYVDTFLFLQNVEQKQVKILWDDMTYEVTKYPLAHVKLTMHTLSTEVGWLNV